MRWPGGIRKYTGDWALFRFFQRSSDAEAARALYAALVAQARRPEFYQACGVPDTIDGRFELIALHAFLILRRLKQDHDRTAGLSQNLFDALFLDMDRSLRELGVGDLGVGRRVRAMAEGLYGRIAAYEAGLADDAEQLTAALERNLFGTVAPEQRSVQVMASYLRREAGELEHQQTVKLLRGEVRFGPPPAETAERR